MSEAAGAPFTSALRPPTVAGVGGGVATTTLAVALRARDAGRAPDGADILACRGRLDSLRRAAAVLDRAGPGPRPVLAVTLDGRRLPRGPIRAHLDQLAAVASAVVLLPDVDRWRSSADPLPEVATLLVAPAERLPRPLRAYAAALAALAAAVTASGRLATAPERARRPPATPQGGGADGSRVPAAGGGARPEQWRPAPPDPVPPDPVLVTPPRPAPVLPVTAGRAGTAEARTAEIDAPRIVGRFRPVVGPATVPGAPRDGSGPRVPAECSPESAALMGDGRGPTRARTADAAPGPRHPRGVRIVGPTRSRPVAGPWWKPAEDGPARAATPPSAVEQIEQVG